jgi:hypothetical protein
LKLRWGALGAFGLAAAPRVRAQEAAEPSAWLFTAGVSVLEFKNDKAFGLGPTIGPRRMLSHRMALALDFTGFTTTGSDRFDGVWGNIGPAFVWRGEKSDVGLAAGFSVPTGWEKAGGQASTIGVYGAAHGTYWLGRTLGLNGWVRYHLWWGDPSYSATASIALRW